MGATGAKYKPYNIADDDITDSFCSDGTDSNPDSEPKSEDTLIIFDWDDTLLPTSAINVGMWTPEEVAEVEKVVTSILADAKTLGEVAIVTNGNATWVHDSSRRFAPSLLQTLDDINVVSARAQFERFHLGDPFSWKRQAFKKILEDKRAKDGADRELNVLVIGDAPVEMEAVHLASEDVEGANLIKTVKFMELPFPSQLLGQLRLLEQELSCLVHSSRSCSRALASKNKNDESQAASWRFAKGQDWAHLQFSTLAWRSLSVDSGIGNKLHTPSPVDSKLMGW